ncbi:Uncharacterized protein Adt_25855 [Abeliophyllum distichum]|uniref:Uncharacterized protein n=1 Tax=Abeliophyllum distichum TaxID=126358 RepID=A0ABD1RP93_9LAMI
MESTAGDPYASIWHLCKTPSFRLPQSPPQPHPTADRRGVEYCLFGPIPEHLISHYLCFQPTTPPNNNPTNQERDCSSSLRDSQSPLNFVNSDNTPHCVDNNDQTTTRPCSNVCYEDDSVSDQGYSGFGNDIVQEDQNIDTPTLCVLNFQDSLPPTPREEEMSLGAGDPYGESSILLLEELKELALWDQDCVMDDDDVGYMVSVMSKFRKLAFVQEATMNYKYEVMPESPESKKLHEVSEAKSDKYFTRSMLANANASTFRFIDLDYYTSTKKKKKSNEKQKESQVECEANLGSRSLNLADENVNIEFIDLTEDMLSTEERSNAQPEANQLDNKNMKRVGSFSHCHSSVECSKSISKARKRLLVDSDEPLLKKPKHSLDADCRIHVL